MRRLNGWLTIFWLLMIPVSIWTHWISSVAYVAALTLWGLVSGHWSAWQGARVEVKQEGEGGRRGGGAARVEVKQEAEGERREEVAEEIVEKIANQSGVAPTGAPRDGPDAAS